MKMTKVRNPFDGFDATPNWDAFLRWFDRTYPCYTTLIEGMGEELEKELPGIPWED